MPGPVFLDPWSAGVLEQCSVTDSSVNASMLMQKCHDTSTSANCYAEFGDNHIVYNKYDSCTESWLLLPGFNLLPNNFLIGMSIPHSRVRVPYPLLSTVSLFLLCFGKCLYSGPREWGVAYGVEPATNAFYRCCVSQWCTHCSWRTCSSASLSSPTSLCPQSRYVREQNNTRVVVRAALGVPRRDRGSRGVGTAGARIG
jgi:hypothetical protein